MTQIYIPKTTPYSQQTAALNHTAKLKFAALFMEQGTGKTKVTIDRSVMAFEAGKIDAVLIICPKSLTETWVEEIITHCPLRVMPNVKVWNNNLPKWYQAELSECLDSPKVHKRLSIFIVNVEGLRTTKLYNIIEWWTKRKRIHGVVDESTTIKTPGSQQSVAAAAIGAMCHATTIMTGTPYTKSPADVFAQLRFLSPYPLGFANYYSFRAHFCVVETKTITFRAGKRKGKKTRKITEIKGPKNAEELKRRLLPFSYFVKKDDCLDLPPKIYHKAYCDLTKAGKRLYCDVAKKILIEIEQSRHLTIEVQLARLCRLQQVTGGFLPDDDDNELAPAIPGENPKIKLLSDTLERFPGPALIWARFKPEHIAIIDMLREHVDDSQIGEITGRIKKDEREDTRRSFQSGHKKYIVCTQSCAGYGYTLTAAESEIYFSNTFSLEHRLQSEDRAHRIGLTHKVNYIDLICRTPKDIRISIDQKVYDSLMAKKDMADYMTDVKELL